MREQMFCITQGKKPWMFAENSGLKIWHAGSFTQLEQFIALAARPSFDMEEITSLLDMEHQSFGLIIEGKNFCLAVCDRTQSYPVYYDCDRLKISFHAQDLLLSPATSHIDDQGVLEFAMTGYTLGPRTLYKNIRQLQAGELLYIENQSTNIRRYYTYAPKPALGHTEQALCRELGAVLDEVIERTIASCKGNPICVPLSGGLDSRLLLAKFHEHGVKELYSFSYGLKNNFEARTARKVARQIGVPWAMIPAAPAKARFLFRSQVRKNYEEFAHGCSRIPSYVEFEAIHNLRQQKGIPAESIIINGQTGDFISGGHIPPVLYEQKNPTRQDVLDYVIAKHCSLWRNLKTPENIGTLETNIKALLLSDSEAPNRETLMRDYESFEWQERQCKTVVNAQKTYDFFDYDWRLPFWDKAFMDFFEGVPFELKYRQKLFKQYLQQYNYKGVFSYGSARPVIWQPHQYWILCIGRLLGLKSAAIKEDFYKKNLYYGDQFFQYALFGKPLYDQHYKNLRNMISLAVLDFLDTHEFTFPAS